MKSKRSPEVKERSLVDSEDFNQSLIIKEREIKDEQLERNWLRQDFFYYNIRFSKVK